MALRTKVLAISVLACVLALAGCSSALKLIVVPTEDVPGMMREFASDRGDVGVVWRAVFEQDSHPVGIYNFTSTRATPGAVPSGVQWLVFDEGGQLVMEVSEAATGDTYWGGSRYTNVREDAGFTASDIYAYGWAVANKAKQVVGTTSLGSKTEGQVVNGHWLLHMTSVRYPEVFVEVDVQDAQGKVLHTLTVTPP